MRHFLEVDDLGSAELAVVLAMSGTSGAARNHARPLSGKGVALVFEKASNRTRNSMELAVTQLGGHPVYIRPEEIGIDTRESAEDVIHTLACFHELVAARVLAHSQLERMAACNVVPVVNLLSDQAHPLQALADLLTIVQHFGGTTHPVAGRPLRVAFVGDANNVWHSLAIGCALVGIESVVSAPPSYGPTAADLQRVSSAGGAALVIDDPTEAVIGADVVYTDVWTSMGQENERSQRLSDFSGYQVDAKLMSLAAAGCIFMHCLPVHRGEEVTGEVVDGVASVVWQQAENRMHAARGLLTFMAETSAVLENATTLWGT